MMEELGVAKPENIGYYSGLVDSCSALAQLFVVCLVSQFRVFGVVLYL